MKKKIVIASVLKPVDDVRVYWKFSQSMAKTNKYEVNIIGNAGKKETDSQNIKFHPHHISRGSWLKRLILREKILIRILRIRPSILIITTHELINVSIVAKLLIRCKLIYDVQENFYLNISAINPTPARKLLAGLVKMKERLCRSSMDQFWLAERSYLKELPFTSSRSLVIENKAIEYPMQERKMNPIHMLFSGTISAYGGVQRALDSFIKIQKTTGNSSMHIIGQIHDKSLHQWLEKMQKLIPELSLTVSRKPIPYDDILKAISLSNLGVIGYESNEINKDKMPTKLYEYSRYRLPYLVQQTTKWSEQGGLLGGAIPVDFNTFDPDFVLEKLMNPANLFPESYPDEAKWEHESEKILISLNSLII